MYIFMKYCRRDDNEAEGEVYRYTFSMEASSIKLGIKLYILNTDLCKDGPINKKKLKKHHPLKVLVLAHGAGGRSGREREFEVIHLSLPNIRTRRHGDTQERDVSIIILLFHNNFLIRFNSCPRKTSQEIECSYEEGIKFVQKSHTLQHTRHIVIICIIDPRFLVR